MRMRLRRASRLAQVASEAGVGLEAELSHQANPTV